MGMVRFLAAAAICLAALAARADEDEGEADVTPLFAASVLYGGNLVTLSPEGELAAWDIAAGRKDAARSAALGALTADGIFATGGGLWAIAKKQIWRWDDEGASWISHHGIPAKWGEVDALAVAGGNLYALGRYQAVSVKSGKTYVFPGRGRNRNRTVGTTYTGYSQVEVVGDTIWMGMAWGEWGGAVLTFDAKRRTWQYDYNPLLYVTGIAPLPDGRVVAGWAMSHMFMNSGDISFHQPDGAFIEYALDAEGDGEEAKVDLAYVERVAYDAATETIYAVDGHDLVAVKDRAVAERHPLGQLPYPYGTMAVGVGPSIVGLYAVDGEVIIVHYASLPFVYAGGVLTQMEE